MVRWIDARRTSQLGYIILNRAPNLTLQVLVLAGLRVTCRCRKPGRCVAAQRALSLIAPPYT